MAPSAEPLRLQIINRIITVLKAIVSGNDYFYTPFAVEKRFVHWEEAKGFPTYMVFTDSGGTVELEGAPDLYDEDFYISIKGIVQDHSDTVTKMERCVRDIRKAVNDDSKSGAAGSLGVLTVETRMEEGIETDNGYLSLQGFGFFEFRVRVKISGDYGEL